MPYVVPSECPECQHEPVTEVLYGLMRKISPALQADLKAKRKKLGGCVMDVQASPAYGCLHCGWTETLEQAEHPLALMAQQMEKETS